MRNVRECVRRYVKSLVKVSLIAIVLLGLPKLASASSFSFYLAEANSGISSFPGPYALVNINLDVTQTMATITFTALPGYLLAGQGAAAVNANGNATVSNITSSNTDPGFTSPGPMSDGGSGNEDGFGKFSNTLDSFDGYQSSNTFISFLLTKSSGTWADAQHVLAPNNNQPTGELAAAHIFVCTENGQQKLCDLHLTSAPNTGYAADTGADVNPLLPPPPPPPTVPEPATLALFGSGLVLLAGQARRRSH
jgi:hypothetical protein